MKYLVIAAIILLASCKKETVSRPPAVKYDTTGYFRITDSATGHYCFSRLKPSIYPGKIDVTLKSIPDSANWIIIYNMPQLNGVIEYFKDYFVYAYHENYPYAEARINGRFLYSKIGGWVRKTGLFKFDFNFKFDELSHYLVGNGTY